MILIENKAGGVTVPPATNAVKDNHVRASNGLKKLLENNSCEFGRVVVKAMLPTITLDIPGTKQIWPTLPPGRSGGNPDKRNIQQNIRVTVSKGGTPLDGYEVLIKTKMILPSGGHDHTTFPSLDLLGMFKDTRRGTSGNGSLTTITSNAGEILLEYTAPKFSGKFEISAESTSDAVKAKDTMKVRVTDLIAMGADTSYELVGAPDNHSGTNDPCRLTPPTSQHSENHFGTAAMNRAVGLFATRYDSLHPGIRIRINDMSLEWGGQFDIGNNWKDDGVNSHAEHRIGKSADIGYTGINRDGRCVNLNRRDLRAIIDFYTDDDIYPHDDHFHIRTIN